MLLLMHQEIVTVIQVLSYLMGCVLASVMPHNTMIQPEIDADAFKDLELLLLVLVALALLTDF